MTDVMMFDQRVFHLRQLSSKERSSMPARSIRTVDELIAALRAVQRPSEYIDLLKRVAVAADQLEPLCTWNAKRYTRNCLDRTSAYELLLICYEPGQRTSIHDFATEEAWVHPVAGSVVEERFAPAPDGSLKLVGATRLDHRSFSYLHNGRSIHRYTNDSGERAITLNLYAKPLRTWKVYDERTGDTSIRGAGS
jgi:cysteine dioxygenase